MRVARPSPQKNAELSRRHEKRLSEAIARLGCCNMNDTKWGEFFAVLLATPRSTIRIETKMLYNEKPTVETWLRRVDPRWTDSFEGPFQNREIEWIEVLGDRTDDILLRLKGSGQLPIVKVASGFRLIAYGPIQIVGSEGSKV